jgi:hypothetical protein
VVRILNNQLQALMRIDAQTEEVGEKLSSLTADTKGRNGH